MCLLGDCYANCISTRQTELVKLLVMSSVMTMGTNRWWKDSRILPTSCFLSDREKQRREKKSKIIPLPLLPQTYLTEDAFKATDQCLFSLKEVLNLG